MKTDAFNWNGSHTHSAIFYTLSFTIKVSKLQQVFNLQRLSGTVIIVHRSKDSMKTANSNKRVQIN